MLDDTLGLRQRQEIVHLNRVIVASLLFVGQFFLPLSNSYLLLITLVLLLASTSYYLLNLRLSRYDQQRQLSYVSFATDATIGFAVLLLATNQQWVVFIPIFSLFVAEAAYLFQLRGIVLTATGVILGYWLAWFLGDVTAAQREATYQATLLGTLFSVLLAVVASQFVRQRSQHERLFETLLSFAASTSLDQELLQEAARQASLLVKADAGRVVVVDETTGSSRVTAGYNLSPDYLHKRQSKANVRLREFDRYLCIDDVAGYLQDQAELIKVEGLRTALAVSLVNPEGERLGMLTVYSRSGRKFTADDARLLLPLADKLTGPLTFLREKLRLEQQVAGLEAIERSAAAVVADLDPGQVLNTVLEAVSVNLRVSSTSILLLDEQSQTAYVACARGLSEEYVQTVNRGGFTSTVETVAGQALIERRVVSTPDVLGDVRYPGNQHLAQLGGIRAMMATPLVIAEEAIGAIVVYGNAPHQFTASDERLLTMFASYASTAIKNARLYSQVQAQNEQLRSLDKLKGDFLARLSHELRSPLTVMLAYTEVLKDGTAGPLTEQQVNFLAAVQRAGQEQLAAIEALLNLTHLEADAINLQVEPIALCPFLNMVLEEVRPRAEQAGVVLCAPECRPDQPLAQLRVAGDTVLLRLALLNLLGNAVKFNRPGGRVTVGLQRASRVDQVVVTIADTGVGIAPEQLSSIWVSFNQAEDAYRRAHNGLGLGLPISRQIVEKHGGRIWAESRLGQGSTFYVALPLTVALPQPDLIGVAN